MKKIIFSLVVLLSLCTFVFAESDSNIMDKKSNVIKFNEMYLEDDLLKEKDDVEIEYKNEKNKQIAEVRDSITGEIIEIISLEKLPEQGYSDELRSTYNSNIHPYVLTRDVNHGGLMVRISINVDFYSNGSFREVTDIKGYSMHILNPITSFEFENQKLNVWSTKPLPTIEVSYAYNTTVKATVSKGSTWSLGAELEGIGFSISGSSGLNNIYRKYIDSAGKIYIRWDYG